MCSYTLHSLSQHAKLSVGTLTAIDAFVCQWRKRNAEKINKKRATQAAPAADPAPAPAPAAPPRAEASRSGVQLPCVNDHAPLDLNWCYIPTAMLTILGLVYRRKLLSKLDQLSGARGDLVVRAVLAFCFFLGGGWRG